MKLAHSYTVEQSGVFMLSLEGVRRWLADEWAKRVEEPTLTVLLTANQTDKQQVDLLQGRGADDTTKMPYALLVVTSVMPRTEGFNRMALQMIGIRTGRVRDNVERREKLTPVDVGIGVKMVCRDPQEALMLARLWVENTPAARLRVVQRSTGFSFDLTIVPDPSVDIPTDDAAPDKSLEVVTTLILKTFTGTSEQNKLITKTRHSLRDTDMTQPRDEWDRGVALAPDYDVDFYTLPPERRDRVLARVAGGRR